MKSARDNKMFLCCIFTTVQCVIKVSSELHAQRLWWVSPWKSSEKNSIWWCHVLFRQSTWYRPECMAIKAETVLRKTTDKTAECFGWLGFVEQVLKIAEVLPRAEGWGSRAEVVYLFWSAGKGSKERRLACFTCTLPSSSLTSNTCCWNGHSKDRGAESWKSNTPPRATVGELWQHLNVSSTRKPVFEVKS